MELKIQHPFSIEFDLMSLLTVFLSVSRYVDMVLCRLTRAGNGHVLDWLVLAPGHEGRTIIMMVVCPHERINQYSRVRCSRVQYSVMDEVRHGMACHVIAAYKRQIKKGPAQLGTHVGTREKDRPRELRSILCSVPIGRPPDMREKPHPHPGRVGSSI
jgi:hypothetical protein